MCHTQCVLYCALCGSSTKCLELPVMSMRVPVSPEYKERTMHTITHTRQIQETAQRESYDYEPPGLIYLSPGGQYLPYETDEQYAVESMTQKQNGKNWAVLFDMVAELAIW
eukprot:4972767-Amphidinium_carterae.1